MRTLRTILLGLMTLTLLPLAAQSHKSVLPYRLVGGKMIVEMQLNGVLRSFIFDTGASRTTLTGEICRELGLDIVDSLKVTDANGNTTVYPLVGVESMQTTDNVFRFRSIHAMTLPEPSPFACFGVDGLIGSDLFRNLMLEIDGKAHTITLMTAENESSVSLRNMARFTTAGMPVVTLTTGNGANLTCLFDTGCPHFLSLKRSDHDILRDAGALTELTEGEQVGAISVGGQAATSRETRARIDKLAIGAVKFLNVTAETGTPPYTLLGVKSLDYGKVVIDYPRGRLYFDAYEMENEVEGDFRNVRLQVKDGELVVGGVWGDIRDIVALGDKVVKINGEPVRTYDFCDALINGIPELKAKKKTKITILTSQGEKTIQY